MYFCHLEGCITVRGVSSQYCRLSQSKKRRSRPGHRLPACRRANCWTCCSSSCAEGGQEDDNVHRWSDGLILEDGSKGGDNCVISFEHSTGKLEKRWVRGLVTLTRSSNNVILCCKFTSQTWSSELCHCLMVGGR